MSTAGIQARKLSTTALVNRAVGGDLASVLPDDGRPWYKVAHLIKLNAILVCLLCYSGTQGYDGSMMNGLQSLQTWQVFMNHPKGAWLGFVNAVQALGGLLCLPLEAYCSDRWGRKPCLFVGTVFVVLASALQAGAKNPAMFVIARFIIGLSSAWFTIAAILITEIAFPTHRAKVTAMYNCQYYVGSLLSAWITFGVRNLESSWSWRIPSLLQLAIPVFALIGAIFSPESPRWLVSQGRVEEARAVLTEYHAGGDRESPLVLFELEEIERSIALERQAKESASYMDMLKTKGNRHRLFISVSLGFFAQWNGNGIAGYYLSIILTTVGITSVTQQTLLNGFLQLWNLIMALGAAVLVDRLGRRTLFLAATVTMLVAYICITGLSGSFASSGVASVGTAVIPFLFIFYAGYDIAFTPLLVSYPAEIWTFALRARGLAVTLISTYVGLLFNLFVNPIALDKIAWKYYIVYVCILIVILVTIILFYPETRGHSLEEMAYIFDGSEAKVPTQDEMLAKVEHTDVFQRRMSLVGADEEGRKSSTVRQVEVAY